MTNSTLMRQIADAMERNPERWWTEFEWVNIYGCVMDTPDPDTLFYAMSTGRGVRPKPSTYTLHVEEMPEPIRCPLNKAKRYFFVNSRGQTQGDIWLGSKTDYMRLNFGNVFYSREEAKARAEAEQRLFGINEDS